MNNTLFIFGLYLITQYFYSDNKRCAVLLTCMLYGSCPYTPSYLPCSYFGTWFETETEIVVLSITFVVVFLGSKAPPSSVQTLASLKSPRKPSAGPVEEEEDEEGVFNEQNYVEALGTQGEMVKLYTLLY